MQWGNKPAPAMPDYVKVWRDSAMKNPAGSLDGFLCQCDNPRKIAMSNSANNPGRWYAACPKSKAEGNCPKSFCWIEDPANPAPAQKRGRQGGSTYSTPAAVGIPDDVKLAITETSDNVKDLRALVEHKLLPMIEMLMATKDEKCPAGK